MQIIKICEREIESMRVERELRPRAEGSTKGFCDLGGEMSKKKNEITIAYLQ